ncbi:hypothetical protein F5X96DRAFT_655835 [Biscogniauxia mediterranea]|nr:hypothetical protein F5X96DRAFT_655835 [Biscogniauxia mediterranea]
MYLLRYATAKRATFFFVTSYSTARPVSSSLTCASLLFTRYPKGRRKGGVWAFGQREAEAEGRGGNGREGKDIEYDEINCEMNRENNCLHAVVPYLVFRLFL